MTTKLTIPGLTDSRGQKSKTLLFVAIAFFALVVKFLLAGLSIPHLGTVPAMSAGEFGGAIFGTLMPWIAREWKAKQLAADKAKNASAPTQEKA